MAAAVLKRVVKGVWFSITAEGLGLKYSHLEELRASEGIRTPVWRHHKPLP